MQAGLGRRGLAGGACLEALGGVWLEGLAGGAWLEGLGWGLGWSGQAWLEGLGLAGAAGAEGVWPEGLLVLVSWAQTRKHPDLKRYFYTTSAAVAGWPPSTYLKTVTVRGTLIV